ncbi:UDP-3-O-(3-hydroxymyristoyl)glucosamine N-acyltransferase [Horticoccus sp. 23ND18S-11]|uniref:UDP-3-O-(3-hydroxymyristoyl)glucosamine N-acyltransferase n=1 Tax=Horticoccus sp. 23ND18S-11 TaxID=3391832 RepID=UPI0039C9760E
MQVSFTTGEIATITQATGQRGSTTEVIRGISGLAKASAGDLSFLGNAKYKAEVATTRASVVLLPADFTGEPPPGQLYLFVENPSVALARVCAHLERLLWPKPATGIHPSAWVDATATVAATATIGPMCIVEAGAVIGERVHVQAQVFVGRAAKIGDDSWLMPGVVVAAECRIGQRVQLQPGVIIGGDGFGYEFVQGRHEKVPQVGAVVVGDDVEIGANSTIDRARFSQTVIGDGTKIDNLVQIGHNVQIGRHCMICGQVGISGSAKIEDYVVLGGQAGVAGHITVGKGVKAGGKSGISSDVAPGSFINGNPAIPYLLERRIAILHQRLPELFKRVDSLEEQLADAKKTSS